MRLRELNWLWVAAGGTIVYLALIVWWIGGDRLTAFLSKPELNEFGDFVAGVFAPLAFLWLIAAVITQRQELDESREVVAKQLSHIEAQNIALADQQTKAEESARKTYRLNLFDKRYELYLDFIAFGEKHNQTHYMDDAFTEMLELHQRSLFIFDKDVADWFGEIAEVIYDHDQFRRQETFTHINEAGTSVLKFRSEKSEKEINATEGWLYDQFNQIDIRADRFEPSMRVSDV